MLYLYAARNFSALVGLASPEPMANMYDPTYYRATWVLTALDAGFWTAMKIKTKWLRDIASIVFSLLPGGCRKGGRKGSQGPWNDYG